MGEVQVGRAALSLSPLAERGRIASAIRVRGSLRGFLCLPDSRMEPLTPTLSPQARGEGVELMRGDHT